MQRAAKDKKYVPADEKKPVKFSRFAKSLHDVFWYRRRVSEGTKGPIEYEFTKRRVTLCREGMPGKTVWLIIKRTIGKDPSYSFYISNAPIGTRLKTFVWLSGIRWAIEQCFEEAKTELGMDHYEVRKYPGWRHHMLSCILAHFFLWHMRIRVGKKAPSLTISLLRVLIETILPLRNYDLKATLHLAEDILKRNHASYLSHRRKRMLKNKCRCRVKRLSTKRQFIRRIDFHVL